MSAPQFRKQYVPPGSTFVLKAYGYRTGQRVTGLARRYIREIQVCEAPAVDVRIQAYVVCNEPAHRRTAYSARHMCSHICSHCDTQASITRSGHCRERAHRASPRLDRTCFTASNTHACASSTGHRMYKHTSDSIQEGAQPEGGMGEQCLLHACNAHITQSSGLMTLDKEHVTLSETVAPGMPHSYAGARRIGLNTSIML